MSGAAAAAAAGGKGKGKAAGGGRGGKAGAAGAAAADSSEQKEQKEGPGPLIEDEVSVETTRQTIGNTFFDVRRAVKHPVNVRQFKDGPEFVQLFDSLRTKGFGEGECLPRVMNVTATVALQKGWITPEGLAEIRQRVRASVAAKWEDAPTPWKSHGQFGTPFKEQLKATAAAEIGMTGDEPDDEFWLSIVMDGYHRTVACTRLHDEYMLADRAKPVGQKMCALNSPFIPCLMFKSDTSDRVVQRVSYQGNATAQTIVKMDLHAQFTAIRNAIGLRMKEREEKWTNAGTPALKEAVKPFDTDSKDDRKLVMQDLGFHAGLEKKIKDEFVAHYDQYLAIVKWGNVPPADGEGIEPKLVSNVRFEEFTTDVSMALKVRGAPVPFELNPAMGVLSFECARAESKCKFGVKSLRHFTNKLMTTENGYVKGCGEFILNCMLSNTPDHRLAAVTPAQMGEFIAMYHQYLWTKRLREVCVKELKDLNVDTSLNSAEESILLLLPDKVSYLTTTPAHAALCQEATGCLARALAKLKAAAPGSHLEVEPVGHIVEAKKAIIQVRAAVVIAEKMQKEKEIAEAKKAAVVAEANQKAADKVQAEREAKALSDKKKAAEVQLAQEVAAAAAANEAEKAAANQRVAQTKAVVKQEAEKVLQAEKKVEDASVEAARASETAESVTKEVEKLDESIKSMVPLPPVKGVETGELPILRGGQIQKSKAKAKEIAQAGIAQQAQVEIDNLLALQPDDASAMSDDTSGISGVTNASSSTRRSVVYLNQRFPSHLEDATAFLKRHDFSSKSPIYDLIIAHPPGVHSKSENYTDTPLSTPQLTEMITHAAAGLKDGGTMVLHVTHDQYVKIVATAMNSGASNSTHLSYAGCRLERLGWYFTGGEPRPNASVDLVNVIHDILLLRKCDNKGHSRADWKFSGYTHYKTIGEQGNLWVAPPLESVKQEQLAVAETWREVFRASKLKNAEQRQATLPLRDGIPSLPIDQLVKAQMQEKHDDKEDGGEYKPPGAPAAPKREASESSNADSPRHYSGSRTQRIKLRPSEIPQNITERLLKIFLPAPDANGSYDGIRVLDLYAGTQSVALAAIQMPELEVTAVDFDVVVTTAAKLRLIAKLDERFDEQIGTTPDDLNSLFHRYKLQGLSEAEIEAEGANLGPELHRQCALLYRAMIVKETNCREAHGVCKICGRALVDLARDTQNNEMLVWNAKRGINELSKRDGFCSPACHAFNTHVVLASSHHSGSSRLKSSNNLLYTSFQQPPPEEDLPQGGTSKADKVALDAAKRKRVPEPKGQVLNFKQREALLSDAKVWKLQVTFSAKAEGQDSAPMAVSADQNSEAGDVLGCLTGDVAEEGKAADEAFQKGRRPPVDITTLLWSHIHKDQIGKAVTKRQWLIPTMLCAASWIQPSDDAHPPNVTISPNFLAMSPHSRIGDMSILPPGALSIIANKVINKGDRLFYDAKQLVTRPRNIFSLTPVLTSDDHDALAVAEEKKAEEQKAAELKEEEKKGPVVMEMDMGDSPPAVGAPAAGAPAAGAPAAAGITFFQPWFAKGWAAQLEKQKKLPAKRAQSDDVAAESKKTKKWLEVEPDSDDDEEELKEKLKAQPKSSSKKRASRVSTRKLPKDLKDALSDGGFVHEVEYKEGVGYVPKPNDEEWFKGNADAQKQLKLYNEKLLAELSAADTESNFGLGKPEDEEKETVRIDQFVADKLELYAKEAAAGSHMPMRTRMRRLPKPAPQEILLLVGQGKDADTQDELRVLLGEDTEMDIKSSNKSRGHAYSSIIMENVDELNQYSLLKRMLFFEALLKSTALRAFIETTAVTQNEIQGWQLCKLFLQQYCKILDALDTRVNAEGKLQLAESPAAVEDAVEAQHWNDISKFAPPLSDANQALMLPEDHLLWSKFISLKRLILSTTDCEPHAKAEDVPAGLLFDKLWAVLLPSKTLQELEPHAFQHAVREANSWNNIVVGHRRMVFGRELFTLRKYQTCHAKQTVSRKFADQWDSWERQGSRGVEPQPSAADEGVFKIFKADRDVRKELFSLLPENNPAKAQASAVVMESPAANINDNESETGSEGAAAIAIPGQAALAGSKRMAVHISGSPGGDEEEGGGKKARVASPTFSAHSSGSDADASMASVSPQAPIVEANQDLGAQDNSGLVSDGEGEDGALMQQ